MQTAFEMGFEKFIKEDVTGIAQEWEIQESDNVALLGEWFKIHSGKIEDKAKKKVLITSKRKSRVSYTRSEDSANPLYAPYYYELYKEELLSCAINVATILKSESSSSLNQAELNGGIDLDGVLNGVKIYKGYSAIGFSQDVVVGITGVTFVLGKSEVLPISTVINRSK